MSLSATGAHKPFQSKPKKNPFLHRTSSSSLNSFPRRKSLQPQPATKRPAPEDEGERIDDTGIVTSVPPRGVKQDVVSLMKHVQANTWNEIPERAAGMNSVRIAEILNVRKGLPAIVSLGHLHALSKSATVTERELARLVLAGVVRKINVFGRGKGGTAIGEGVVLTEDWAARVTENKTLEPDLKDKYLRLLAEHPASCTISSSFFEGTEVADLVQAGFLTITSALHSGPEFFSRSGGGHLGKASSIATSAATGTLAVVGGSSAVQDGGGGSGGLHPSSRRGDLHHSADLTFSLPATGSYLRILTEARAHMLDLLKKSSPRHKEATKEMLRERWDGGIAAGDAATRAKRARGEWVGVLPGKTKKWKSFYGLDFKWVLEECLGCGVVECFNTGSVGLGVRVT